MCGERAKEAALKIIFVASRNALSHASGGVQIYTRELRSIIAAAGLEEILVPYEVDMRPSVRVRRLTGRESYRNKVPPSLTSVVRAAQKNTGAPFVFLHGVELAPLAGSLRRCLPPDVQVVLFSFGLKSVDYLYRIDKRGRRKRAVAQGLGSLLLDEHSQRNFIDHVFCLSEFETGIERWLGARKVAWLPRVVERSDYLLRRPIKGRFGCVSTLEHQPNLDGLTEFLERFQDLADSGTEFRLVGGPAEIGQMLKVRFPFVGYLGRLTDEQLRDEAATWSMFVHPLFCYAAGSSMKLGTALSWGMPILTTPAGMRGYSKVEGAFQLGADSKDLAQLAAGFLKARSGVASEAEVDRILSQFPTAAQVGEMLRDALGVGAIVTRC